MELKLILGFFYAVYDLEASFCEVEMKVPALESSPLKF